MDFVLLGKYSVTALAQLLISALVALYLFRLHRRSRATRLLAWFFVAFSAALVANFAFTSLNVRYIYVGGFAQAVAAFASMSLLCRFAYAFPREDRPVEARRVARAFDLTLVAYLGVIAWVMTTWSEQGGILLRVSGAVLVAQTLWLCAVFVRRARRAEERRERRAHWQLAGAMLAWVAITVVNVLESLALASTELLLLVLATSMMLFVIALALIYLNNAVEPTRFMAKLVGVPLVVSLALMADWGVMHIMEFEAEYARERDHERGELRAALREGRDEVPDALQWLGVYELAATGDAPRTLFARDGFRRTAFYEEVVSGQLGRAVLGALRRDPSTDPEAVKARFLDGINRMQLLRLQREYEVPGFAAEALRHSVFYLREGGRLYELVYPYLGRRRYVHPHAARAMALIVFDALLILLFLPLVYRRVVVRPLASLLEGVRRVDRGERDVELPVHVDDELGHLARSFNTMVRSLEQAEAQRHLVMRDRMRALSSLVAGVAHEVNNPAGAVKSAADVTERCLTRLEPELANAPASAARALELLRRNAGVTREAAERLAELVRGLEAFVHLDEAEMQRADLHAGLRDCLLLLRHKMPPGVEVETRFGELGPIWCNPGQLNQVFMNLIRNAVQAVGERGRVEIVTDRENGAARVRIRDNGVGMRPEEVEALFDVHFSARERRVRMGSGLAVAQHVVREHGGQIQVQSAPGEGTEVTLLLPVDGGRHGACAAGLEAG